jgi:hypothetical protein
MLSSHSTVDPRSTTLNSVDPQVPFTIRLGMSSLRTHSIYPFHFTASDSDVSDLGRTRLHSICFINVSLTLRRFHVVRSVNRDSQAIFFFESAPVYSSTICIHDT